MRIGAMAMAAFAALTAFAAPAAAQQSCWMHNGSLVRMLAAGDARKILYEEPRPGLKAIGVKRGTVLFTGERRGNSYSGLARMFSTECPGAVTQYAVEGKVTSGQTRIVLRGRRELYRHCAPTDRFVEDTLVFTYVRKC